MPGGPSLSCREYPQAVVRPEAPDVRGPPLAQHNNDAGNCSSNCTAVICFYIQDTHLDRLFSLSMEPLHWVVRFPYPVHILQFTHDYFNPDTCCLGPWDFLGGDGTTYSYPSGFHRHTTDPSPPPLHCPRQSIFYHTWLMISTTLISNGQGCCRLCH